MNRSRNANSSYKKNKASGYMRLIKTSEGKKIIRARRKKGRRIL